MGRKTLMLCRLETDLKRMTTKKESNVARTLLIKLKSFEKRRHLHLSSALCNSLYQDLHSSFYTLSSIISQQCIFVKWEGKNEMSPIFQNFISISQCTIKRNTKTKRLIPHLFRGLLQNYKVTFQKVLRR